MERTSRLLTLRPRSRPGIWCDFCLDEFRPEFETAKISPRSLLSHLAGPHHGTISLSKELDKCGLQTTRALSCSRAQNLRVRLRPHMQRRALQRIAKLAGIPHCLFSWFWTPSRMRINSQADLGQGLPVTVRKSYNFIKVIIFERT